MTTSITAGTGRISESDCHVDDFARLVQQETDLADYPFAAETHRGVLFYSAAAIRALPDRREEIADEFARAFLDGPGIVVIKGAYGPEHALAETTDLFTRIIAEQRASGVVAGDHFAKPGANDRIWNALQKLALTAPELFVRYYANDILALVSYAWLGPMYQVTSAINVVNPGGQAQNPHRDYHLGFMSTDTAARFRAHTHRLSPALTLQGAVAHVDMPLESGPTMYLPYSQRYEPGYLAFNLPEFRAYFDAHYVQLPLKAGDAVFFNPALFHAAGTNSSADIKRMANLLQVSSPFGRALDAVDRERIVNAIYPLLPMLSVQDREHVIAAAAEGYAFPSNLDLDQPISGLHGETQAELVRRALASAMSPDELAAELTALTARHTA
ncbi:phytanoyl-CoA dioxygenase family protein [Mycolicibacterium bacteremicum]|uniref:Phytanoyl-CoA dioxygenase n=1 Tax=Mycolicibacterium bacteremicum TaxID=564198 RepID=A0A1W9YN04_MYCBA|nr:phytanoyl-CoA dioxygenase family protein [Mycolicibacterium bacteremicum]MCV7431491.1 phytanoyl-CoA dioxygenase family protein [Mycolicibacterium bacteremicum]ORA01441.1 phytanoyl-CoA dioxygenase [Mycolicibacterium bacteremicum]